MLAQTAYFPLAELRPGLRGAGRTVFSGERIEEFQVEILGALENVGPRQTLVLARLSGGPLSSAGVMQGMSGSPVYIGGRLVGAVAMAFPFSKEPIAGLRPIEEMLRAAPASAAPPVRAALAPWERNLTRVFAPPEPLTGRLVDIATPVSFGGFTRGTLDQFGPELRALGLEPRQAVSGGGRLATRLGDPSSLQPGSMISVQLLSGDMSIGADGTVTHIDGQRVYAFGHRFLSVGATELPFARSEVVTLLQSLSSSFKISTPREWMGSITEDRSTTIAGLVGRRAGTVPLEVTVRGHGGSASKSPESAYRMEVVNDRFLTPLLVQMAVFSAIDATERTVGTASCSVRARVEFQDSATPLRLDNMYTGDAGVPLQASAGAAAPLAYAMQSGLDGLKLKRVSIAIDAFPARRQWTIDRAWTSRREARPGEAVDFTLVLVGENGSESSRRVTYLVPTGAATGPLFFTVADGASTNLAEFQHLITAPPRSRGQVVALLNALRGNTKAYVRVWRADPGFQILGADLAAAPPSLALILARSQAGLGPAAVSRGWKLAEFEVGDGDTVIYGSRTVQVDIKE